MKENKNLKENNIEEVTKLMSDFLEDLIKNMDNKIKNQEKLINSMEKFNILVDLVEDNEKNVDTIHELVNIIQEALREINDIYKPSPKIMKIKKILLKYKENN